MEELARWYDVDVFYMNQQVKIIISQLGLNEVLR